MSQNTEIKAILVEMEAAGQLNAAAVVESARDPASPLHDRFEWDDGLAAEEHRKAQARALIRSIKIRVETHNISLRVPAYVADPEQDSGYVATARLRGDEDRARDVLVTEFARAASALARARAIAAALGMEDEIDTLRGQIIELGDRIAQPPAGAA